MLNLSFNFIKLIIVANFWLIINQCYVFFGKLKGGDTHSTSKILVTIVKLCFQAGNLQLLNENVLLLAKRRSQMKQAITKMIQECCTYVDQISDKELLLTFIDTLRSVTAGKVPTFINFS